MTQTANHHARGTLLACPICGRRLEVARPTIAAACRSWWNTKLPKTHPVTQMRPVENTTST